ncbi:MAG: methionine--tRNA ligase [Planctomycetota bacterium]|nr:methionine--tRNA ligase [Planctomycetota bacterium]
MPNPYYLTTPIYYVNDRAHIGHCYTTTIADVLARYQRLLRGESTPPTGPSEVFLLTGTDEHADKVVTSAAANGHTPQAWCDRNAQAFREAFAFMGVSFTDFIRTTEPRHKDRVPEYVAALIASGDIYKGEYTGWYDEGQEEYVTESAARDAGFKSVISGRPLVQRTEACYFFRLSKYQDALRDLIENNARFIRPNARRQEVLGRLRQGLNDVPVSRPVTDDPATQWGIRIPGDPSHRVYVWIDALFNYLTVVDTPERRRFWPASLHLIGKDILWFHAVIWPALLLALRASGPAYEWVALPRSIFGHGWWVSNGQKMSKSLGNFIDLERLQAYAARYSLDALRWHLLSQGPLGGTDADFSHDKFVEVYNADLANGVGNCVSRVGNMIEKYFAGAMPPFDPAPLAGVIDVPGVCRAAAADALAALAEDDPAGSAAQGARIVRAVDEFIGATAPFKLAKDPANLAQVGSILGVCAEALRVASVLFAPAMPDKMGALWRTWTCAPPPGATLAALLEFGGPHALRVGQRIAKGDNLFQRANPADAPPGAEPATP